MVGKRNAKDRCVMAYYKHREHAGAKNSSAKSGFYGRRADAKTSSKKSRRALDKKLTRNDKAGG